MRPAADVLDEFGVADRGAGRVGAPHASRHARVRRDRGRSRTAGDHRGRGRRRSPAGDAGVGDAAAGHRGAGAAVAPRRHRLAAVDRPDARRSARSRRCRSPARATRGCSRYASSASPTARCAQAMVRFQDGLADTARGKDAALQAEREGERVTRGAAARRAVWSPGPSRSTTPASCLPGCRPARHSPSCAAATGSSGWGEAVRLPASAASGRRSPPTWPSCSPP